jgi:Cys-tRNA(Pro)/Cys-tRNA(Cys) deacylase
MAKVAKNNVLRLLESRGAEYIHYCYDTADGKIDAVSVALKIGRAPEEVFKTLVTRSEGPRYYVFVVPGCCELDLKKAAKAAGEKSIEMISSKELLPLTGYIHGGCSPFGMKKLFPTFVDETSQLYDTICVSAGKVGENLAIAPEDLISVVPAVYADLTR